MVVLHHLILICWNSLLPRQVRVGNSNAKGKSNQAVLSINTVCGTFKTGVTTRKAKITCSKPLGGRYVTIQRVVKEYFQVAEVSLTVREPGQATNSPAAVIGTGGAPTSILRPTTTTTTTTTPKTPTPETTTTTTEDPVVAAIVTAPPSMHNKFLRVIKECKFFTRLCALLGWPKTSFFQKTYFSQARRPDVRNYVKACLFGK